MSYPFYLVSTFNGVRVTKVAATKHTEKSVWIIESEGSEWQRVHRNAISSDHYNYFSTWKEAIDFAVPVAITKIDRKRKELGELESFLIRAEEKLNSLKEDK